MNNPKVKLPRWVLAGLVVLFISLVLFIFRVPFLEKIGANLVYQNKLAPSDAIIVLAGSRTGNRIEEAVRVYHKGMGKVIIFSGYPLYLGLYTHEGMKKYAIKLGVPEDKIICDIASGENSSWGEALYNLKQLESLKAKSFILVTSSFHTRRAHWVYQRAIKELNMDLIFRVQPAPDPKVPIPGWWKVRTGKKQVFNECIKLLYYYITY